MIKKLGSNELGRPSVDQYRMENKWPVVFVLDNLRSALNVGSIFRTADAFRFERIVLCGFTAQPPHREILKTALGSTDSVAWSYFSTARDAVNCLKEEGYIVWAVEQTEPKRWLHEIPVVSEKKYAFVLGNEVEGVGQTVLEACEGAVEIPQFGTKHSLNVSVAAGIVAWELARRFMAFKP